MCIYILTCIYVYIYTYIYIYMYAYVYVCASVLVQIYTHVCISLYAIYTYIYMHDTTHVVIDCVYVDLCANMVFLLWGWLHWQHLWFNFSTNQQPTGSPAGSALRASGVLILALWVFWPFRSVCTRSMAQGWTGGSHIRPIASVSADAVSLVV